MASFSFSDDGDDVQVIDDSASSGAERSLGARSTPPAPMKDATRSSISTIASTSGTSNTSSGRLPARHAKHTAARSTRLDTSSSDVEFVSGPAAVRPSASNGRVAGKDVTNTLRPSHLPDAAALARSKNKSKTSSSIGAFQSASSILKQEVKRDKQLRKLRASSLSSSANSGASSDDGLLGPGAADTAIKRRSKSPYFATATGLLDSSEGEGKGKMREDSLPPPLRTRDSSSKPIMRQLEDEDDDLMELPPPLSTRASSARSTQAEASLPPSAQLPHIEDLEDSPGSTFRNKLNHFKAPTANTASRKTTSSSRAPNTARRKIGNSDATIVLDLSDTSAASTSASTGAGTRSTSSKASNSANGKTGAAGSTSAPLTLPNAYLSVLDTCPVCQLAWTTHKQPAVKQTHIRRCALAKAYSHAEVGELVEQAVRTRMEHQQDQGRQRLADSTLLEGVLSKKGKDVSVVGVERSRKKDASKKTTTTTTTIAGANADGANMSAALTEAAAVLYTQEGSAQSQATLTQVQKEVNGRIKTHQRIERGELAHLPGTAAARASKATASKSRQGSVTSTDEQEGSSTDQNRKGASVQPLVKKKATAADGAGSKSWLKAAAMLKAKDKEAAALEESREDSLLSASYIGASISSALSASASTAGTSASVIGSSVTISVSAAGKKAKQATKKKSMLESYADSKDRLAERAKNMASSRALRLSDGSLLDEDTSLEILHQGPDRAYRNPSELQTCLLDSAIDRAKEKASLGYSAWHLAGSVPDPIPDRYVSSPSPCSPSSDASAVCESLPPIGALSLSSPATSGPSQISKSPPLDASPSRPTLFHDSWTATRTSAAPVYIDPVSPIITAAGDTATSTSTQTHAGQIDSSSGLFASSAALQALTQRLSGSSRGALNPLLRGRKAAPAVAACSVAANTTGLHLPLHPASPPASAQLRPFSTARQSDSGQSDDPVPSAMLQSAASHEYLGMSTDEDSSEVRSTALASTKKPSSSTLASAGGIEKRPRGRPKKAALAINDGSKTSVSPKRKKADDTATSMSDAGLEDNSSSPKKVARKKTITSPAARKRQTLADKREIAASVAAKLASSQGGMPDYENWTKEELQAETGKYGYKPAGAKAVLIRQLEAIWNALNPQASPPKVEKPPPWRARSRSRSPVESPAASPVKKVARGKKAAIAGEEEENAVVAPKKKRAPAKAKKASNEGESEPTAGTRKAKASSTTSAKSKAIAAARAKRKAALLSSEGSEVDDEGSDIHANDEVGEDEYDTETAPEEVKTAGQKLREAVLKDEKLFLRILRYEPIVFDDFVALAQAASVKLSKIALRDWLDSQGIIFYYDQTTGRNAKRNGARQRHP